MDTKEKQISVYFTNWGVGGIHLPRDCSREKDQLVEAKRGKWQRNIHCFLFQSPSLTICVFLNWLWDGNQHYSGLSLVLRYWGLSPCFYIAHKGKREAQRSPQAPHQVKALMDTNEPCSYLLPQQAPQNSSHTNGKRLAHRESFLFQGQRAQNYPSPIWVLKGASQLKMGEKIHKEHLCTGVSMTMQPLGQVQSPGCAGLSR